MHWTCHSLPATFTTSDCPSTLVAPLTRCAMNASYGMRASQLLLSPPSVSVCLDDAVQLTFLCAAIEAYWNPPFATSIIRNCISSCKTSFTFFLSPCWFVGCVASLVSRAPHTSVALASYLMKLHVRFEYLTRISLQGSGGGGDGGIIPSRCSCAFSAGCRRPGLCKNLSINCCFWCTAMFTGAFSAGGWVCVFLCGPRNK